MNLLLHVHADFYYSIVFLSLHSQQEILDASSAHITKQRGKTKQADMIAKVFYTSPRAWNRVLSGRTSDSPRFRKQDQTSRKWRLNSQRLKGIWTGLFPCTWPNIMCFQKHLLFKTKEVNYTIFEQAANRLIHIK